MNWTPLHSGPHDSVSDLTLGDYVLIIVAILALIGIGAALWTIIQRRKEDE